MLIEVNTVNQPRINILGVAVRFLVPFVLAFSSLRGWMVLNLDLSPSLVYSFSSFLLICMSIYGFSLRLRFNSHQSILFRNALKVNLLLGTLFLVVELILGSSISIASAYAFLLPFIVFLFFRTPAPSLYIAFFIIAIGISFSVLSNFVVSLTGDAGYDYLIDYNLKLRPDVFQALSRTGEYFRAGGYTGSYHDSANILGMLGSYYLINGLVGRKLLGIAIGVLVISIMTLTQSTANIVLALINCSLFTIYIVFRERSTFHFCLFMALASVLLFGSYYIPELNIFTRRLGPGADYEGMLAALSVDMLFSPFLWIGHGYAVESAYIKTEVALLKGFLELGVVHALLLNAILTYPLYLFMRNKSRDLFALPYLAAVVFGFISLVHYGSLFRSTNIAVFYAMYALAMMHVTNLKK